MSLCARTAQGALRRPFGGAADLQAFQTGQARGTHHDQVAALLAGLCDDLVLGRSGQIRRRMLHRTVVTRAASNPVRVSGRDGPQTAENRGRGTATACHG